MGFPAGERDRGGFTNQLCLGESMDSALRGVERNLKKVICFDGKKYKRRVKSFPGPSCKSFKSGILTLYPPKEGNAGLLCTGCSERH